MRKSMIAVDESWVELKLAASSASISYTELNKLDIFEFFALLQQVQLKNKPS